MIVFVGFRNNIDWSDGRSIFSAIGENEDDVLIRMGVDPDNWRNSNEYKAYFSVKKYDTETGMEVK